MVKFSLKKIIPLSAIAFSLLLLGYYRDFVFKSINALLKSWDFGIDYYMPRTLSFLENYNYDTLLNIKWLLTLIFSVLYLLLVLVAIKILFNKKKYLKITIGVYCVVIVVSALFIATGSLFSGISEKMYEFSRYLMGMLQSPIILMILIPALKLSEKENTNIAN